MDSKELVEKDGEFKFQSIDDPDVQRLKDSYSKLARSYDKALDDILTIFRDFGINLFINTWKNNPKFLVMIKT